VFLIVSVLSSGVLLGFHHLHHLCPALVGIRAFSPASIGIIAFSPALIGIKQKDPLF